MIISDTICNNIPIIALRGALDVSSALQLKQYAATMMERHTIVFDFTDLDFLDSSGLGALVGIARSKRERSGEIKLACLNDRVRQVFDLTQASRLFDIYDDAVIAATTSRNTEPGL